MAAKNGVGVSGGRAGLPEAEAPAQNAQIQERHSTSYSQSPQWGRKARPPSHRRAVRSQSAPPAT
eukprot:10253834-Lingulodinium_polyedra.AAC.1